MLPIRVLHSAARARCVGGAARALAAPREVACTEFRIECTASAASALASQAAHITDGTTSKDVAAWRAMMEKMKALEDKLNKAEDERKAERKAMEDERKVERKELQDKLDKLEAQRAPVVYSVGEVAAKLEKKLAMYGLSRRPAAQGDLCVAAEYMVPQEAALAAFRRVVGGVLAPLAKGNAGADKFLVKDKSAVPVPVTIGGAGSGKTELLRWLQFRGDARMEGLAQGKRKTVGSPVGLFGKATCDMLQLQRCVGLFATFNSDTPFHKAEDNEETIAQRLMFRAALSACTMGQAGELSELFAHAPTGFSLREFARCVRTALAPGVAEEKVALVLCVDEVTNIKDAPTRECLLSLLGGFQHAELHSGRLTVVVVSSLDLTPIKQVLHDRTQRGIYGLPLAPLSSEAFMTRLVDVCAPSDREEFLASASVAMEICDHHPRRMERVFKRMKEARSGHFDLYSAAPMMDNSEQVQTAWYIRMMELRKFADDRHRRDWVSLTGTLESWTKTVGNYPDVTVVKAMLDETMSLARVITQEVQLRNDGPQLPEVKLRVRSFALLNFDVDVENILRNERSKSPDVAALKALRECLLTMKNAAKTWELATAAAIHVTAQCLLGAFGEHGAVEQGRETWGFDKEGAVSLRYVLPGAAFFLSPDEGAVRPWACAYHVCSTFRKSPGETKSESDKQSPDEKESESDEQSPDEIESQSDKQLPGKTKSESDKPSPGLAELMSEWLPAVGHPSASCLFSNKCNERGIEGVMWGGDRLIAWQNKLHAKATVGEIETWVDAAWKAAMHLNLTAGRAVKAPVVVLLVTGMTEKLAADLREKAHAQEKAREGGKPAPCGLKWTEGRNVVIVDDAACRRLFEPLGVLALLRIIREHQRLSATKDRAKKAGATDAAPLPGESD